MSEKDILIRLVLSFMVGALVGWERERTHRPAGLRTHTLVCVGATVVMLLGFYVTFRYHGMTNADPARLPAQVINGIGFLGAGTILKEGSTIKGLTTAASLWVVACLGLAIGAGFYDGAVVATVAIILTLTVFEIVEKHMSYAKRTRVRIELYCNDVSRTLSRISTLTEEFQANIKDINILPSGNDDDLYSITFKLYPKTNSAYSNTMLINAIDSIQTVHEMKQEVF